MSARAAGQVLRVAGPALQVLALIGLFRPGPSPALRTACYTAFALGLILVLLGLALSAWPTRPDPRRKAPPLDFTDEP